MFDDNQNLTTPTDNNGTVSPADGTLSTHNDASGTPATFAPSTPIDSTTPATTPDSSNTSNPFDPTIIDAVNGNSQPASTAPSTDDNNLDETSIKPSETPTTETVSESETDTSNQDSGDLTSLKQQALQELSPLLGQLDQTPEEKFRTTMMMIQAADDQTLIPTAYEAAKQIKDDKARAQALLDVVNEINYFAGQAKDATKD